MISVTGTWFLIEAFLFDNQISISSEPVIPAIVPRKRADDGRWLAGADDQPGRAIEIAQQKIPGLEASFVSLPAMPTAT